MPSGARGETQQRLAAILGYQPGLACVHSALQQLVNVSGLLSATEIFHHPGKTDAGREEQRGGQGGDIIHATMQTCTSDPAS